jgi:hypothetical protein
MPPQKRTAKSTTPSQKEIDAAVEQSAEYLESQETPEQKPVLGPTTPSKAEVESAVEKSAEYLEEQGVPVDRSSAATPVSSGTPSVGAAPVSAGRDKSKDASPVFESPIPDRPKS